MKKEKKKKEEEDQFDDEGECLSVKGRFRFLYSLDEAEAVDHLVQVEVGVLPRLHLGLLPLQGQSRPDGGAGQLSLSVEEVDEEF